MIFRVALCLSYQHIVGVRGLSFFSLCISELLQRRLLILFWKVTETQHWLLLSLLLFLVTDSLPQFIRLSVCHHNNPINYEQIWMTSSFDNGPRWLHFGHVPDSSKDQSPVGLFDCWLTVPQAEVSIKGDELLNGGQSSPSASHSHSSGFNVVKQIKQNTNFHVIYLSV